MYLIFWFGFIAFVIGMIAFDLGMIGKRSKIIDVRQALIWTGFCALLSIVFAGLVYVVYDKHIFGMGLTPVPLTGREAALQYLTGWLIEQSLSLDNVFVIAVIFSYFKIPGQYQHRVLFWGIVGALVMRGIMIALGTTLLNQLDWIFYVFGALLIYAAVKILFMHGDSLQPRKNIMFRLVHRLYPVSNEFDGEKFFTRINGRKTATPLFVVLVVIESTDVLFAVDSIPAVLAITQDPFLVFTSNIFAILNLRSLYFALAAMMDKFRYLKPSIVALLLFVGVKMMLHSHYHISTEISFLVILIFLGGGVAASLLLSNKPKTDKVGD